MLGAMLLILGLVVFLSLFFAKVSFRITSVLLRLIFNKWTFLLVAILILIWLIK